LQGAVASCVVVFVPVFFANVVFATVFRSSRQGGLSRDMQSEALRLE
jgi:hypothetical protein